MAVSSRPLSEEDQAFVERVFHTYQRLIYATARRVCDNPELWDDIVQESVLRLCRYVKRLRALPERELAAYLAALVRYAAIDLLQEEKLRQERTADWEEVKQSMTDMGPSSEEFLELMERKVKLLEVWPDMTAEERRVLVDWYIGGVSDQEQAERLNCKPDAVRMKRSRARRKALRLMLEKEGGDAHGTDNQTGADHQTGRQALGAV
ncbi:MAG: sigma-70 family RNA polymerase sigma factor [Oscillospiraceae bacterium]|nr:sigma-70 family RNA polymerase sigma factor [Oscillospiraceae bacterium]